jgi:hypothetical protein
VRIVVTEVTGQGSIRRGVLDTAWHSDADRCKDLIKQAALDVPPPYRPEAGRPVYEICVDNKAIWVAWRDLVGPLRELVIMAILTDQPIPGPAGGDDQAEDMTARSPDRPQPGDRGVAAEPVPQHGERGDARAPDDPVQDAQARGLPNGAGSRPHIRGGVNLGGRGPGCFHGGGQPNQEPTTPAPVTPPVSPGSG